MSASAVPLSVQAFEPTTTPVMERANRLAAVRSHAGFLEILRILQDIEKLATDQALNYEGWDTLQIALRAASMRTAQQVRLQLLSRIQDAIDEGVADASRQVEMATLAAKTQNEVVEQGDYVRSQVLDTFAALDEKTDDPMRIAGSY
jgi:hypothetical protein